MGVIQTGGLAIPIATAVTAQHHLAHPMASHHLAMPQQASRLQQNHLPTVQRHVRQEQLPFGEEIQATGLIWTATTTVLVASRTENVASLRLARSNFTVRRITRKRLLSRRCPVLQ